MGGDRSPGSAVRIAFPATVFEATSGLAMQASRRKRHRRPVVGENVLQHFDEALFYNKRREDWMGMFMDFKYHSDPETEGAEAGDPTSVPMRVTVSYRYRKMVSYVMAHYPHERCQSLPEHRLRFLAKDLLFTLRWVWKNFDKSAKRKYVSHVGGYLADWINAEILGRSGRRVKYQVVYNR